MLIGWDIYKKEHVFMHRETGDIIIIVAPYDNLPHIEGPIDERFTMLFHLDMYYEYLGDL